MSRPAVAYIHLEHLRHNYRILKEKAGGAAVMAVVKADAYGHGLAPIASTLHAEGCRIFGVTDAKEGITLRDILNDETTDIVLLSGIFDPEDAVLACDHALVPVITESEHALLLQKAGFAGKVWLKVDTGMNRLGAAHPARLLDDCRKKHIGVAGIMSHLACADTPDHPLNRQQSDEFARLVKAVAPDLPASLLNSAGLVTLPGHALDMIRPGIALYGAEPVPALPLGLKPVMRLTGRVMQVRSISRGATVSYGAAFTADRDMRIATVCLGYADGLPRGLSGKGYGMHAGRRLPILGRVCMDYTMLDITGSDVEKGAEIEFWGTALAANDVAAMLGTISYTLFTGVGQRVRRETVA